MAQLTEHSNNSEKFYKKSPKDQNFLQNFLLPFYNLDFILLQFTLIKRKLSSTYQTTLQSKDFHSKSIMLTWHMDSPTIYLTILGPPTRGGPSKQPKHVLCICQRTCKAHSLSRLHSSLEQHRLLFGSRDWSFFLGHQMGRSPHLQPISSVFIFIRGIFVKPTIPDHKPSLLFWRVRHQGFSICHRRQYRSCSSESLNPGKEILGLTYSCIPYEPQYTEWNDFSFCAIWNEIIECLNLLFFLFSFHNADLVAFLFSEICKLYVGASDWSGDKALAT